MIPVALIGLASTLIVTTGSVLVAYFALKAQVAAVSRQLVEHATHAQGASKILSDQLTAATGVPPATPIEGTTQPETSP